MCLLASLLLQLWSCSSLSRMDCTKWTGFHLPKWTLISQVLEIELWARQNSIPIDCNHVTGTPLIHENYKKNVYVLEVASWETRNCWYHHVENTIKKNTVWNDLGTLMMVLMDGHLCDFHHFSVVKSRTEHLAFSGSSWMQIFIAHTMTPAHKVRIRVLFNDKYLYEWYFYPYCILNII